MTGPTLTTDDYRAAAEDAGVCVRPVIHTVTDTRTNVSALVPIRCGHTRAEICPPCAEKARRLRMHQCREGWHRTTEPDADDPLASDEAETDEGEITASDRRVRSTRRRQDAPDLPRVPMSDRTVGQAFTAPDGTQYRPSMFLTLTLPSYGRVHPDGTPVDPARYDYRRAALDALHVGKLIDRFWQNTRRCAGFHVQYFATIEPQQRRAPHMHAAVRGVLPRATIRQIVAATYVQIWWPPIDHIAYAPDDPQPEWDDTAAAYVDPRTGAILTEWDDALDQLDCQPDAKPIHVARFGRQIDMQGLLAGSPGSERAIGYLTKYLAKSMDSTMHGDEEDPLTDRQEAHIDRLADELRWLPCSPRCSNWLRHGIQPRNPSPGLRAGACENKAHDRAYLGYGGRRVLVSRKWTGKTLTEHRADRAAIVRAALEEAGIEPDEALANLHLDESDSEPTTPHRFVWDRIDPRSLDAPRYGRVIATAIHTAQRWRAQYEQAKRRAGPQLSAIQQLDREEQAS